MSGAARVVWSAGVLTAAGLAAWFVTPSGPVTLRWALGVGAFLVVAAVALAAALTKLEAGGRD